MAIENLVSNTTTAVGPDGLKDALNHIFHQGLQDPLFAAEDHYIMYELGAQKALIKADMSQKPFHFWYCDLLGRPATPGVIRTIEAFLAENGGNQDFLLQFHDIYQKEKESKIAASINGENLLLPEDPKAHAYKVLSEEKRISVTNPKVSRIGLFSLGEKKQLDQKLTAHQDSPPSNPANKAKL